jgi:DNA-binding XRE family transcriptional regulator
VKKDKKFFHGHSRLLEEREKIWQTQQQAADYFGVSRVTWGQCERGNATPSGDVLAGLSDIGADVSYILTGKRCQPLASSPDEEMLMGAYRRATLAQKQAILGAAIGVAPPPPVVSHVSGGSVVQTSQGNGVVQVGKISGNKPRR